MTVTFDHHQQPLQGRNGLNAVSGNDGTARAMTEPTDEDGHAETSDSGIVPNDGTARAVTERAAEAENTAETSDSELFFPKAGLKLSFILNDFINDDCGGRESIEGWTTEQVCRDIIKAKTIKFKASYCDMLKLQFHHAYSETPDVFISHAHCYNFLDVISALECHFLRDKEKQNDDNETAIDPTVWFDLFSINQHQTEKKNWPFDWLSSTFQSAIGQIGRTCMVMIPWNDPIPFTRAWYVQLAL